MKDKEIIIRYLTGTFILTYFMWGAILIFNRYGYLKAGSVGFWTVYSVGGLASTLFGAYLSKKSGKVSNYKALVIETFNIRQRLKHYALVPALFTVSFGISFIFSISEYKMPWYFGFPLIFQMIFFGGLEEIGWRYTFQPALERQMPFVLASTITGCLWAIWHLPLFFMNGMNKGMDFGLFVFGVLSMSFMLGAIYRVSNSLWLCVLFHAMINAFSQVWAFEDNLSDILMATSIKIIFAIIIVSLHKHRTKVVTNDVYRA